MPSAIKECFSGREDTAEEEPLSRGVQERRNFNAFLIHIIPGAWYTLPAIRFCLFPFQHWNGFTRSPFSPLLNRPQTSHVSPGWIEPNCHSCFGLAKRFVHGAVCRPITVSLFAFSSGPHNSLRLSDRRESMLRLESSQGSQSRLSGELLPRNRPHSLSLLHRSRRAGQVAERRAPPEIRGSIHSGENRGLAPTRGGDGAGRSFPAHAGIRHCPASCGKRPACERFVSHRDPSGSRGRTGRNACLD